MYESPIRVPILAVDPGASSGYAFFDPEPSGGWRLFAGNVNPWTYDLDEVIALARARETVALVIEKPGAGGTGRFMSMVVGLAEVVGVWRRQWTVAGTFGGVELDVVQTSWRAGVLGGTSGARTSKEWKAASVEHAEALLYGLGSVFTEKNANEQDRDQADAIGLGWWALHSPALVDKLGSRRCAAAGWDDHAACLAAKSIRTNERSTDT